ncbi:MAG TPA: prohibitin family protein [Nevskiaceae bacterium]|nr:prohibitin family protein [Nevskiaceae bacterium]
MNARSVVPIVLIVVLAVLLIRLSPFTSVAAGHKGVVTTFGKVSPEALDEGLHLINPLSRVVSVSTRIQKVDSQGDAASRDLQSVTTHIALQYHLSAKDIASFYQHVGLGYEDTIVAPQIQETFKAVTARYTAEELITKREEVRHAIRELLDTKLRELTGGGLLVDDFSITNFQFSHSFNAAIEAKQEAEQLALKAKRDLERIQVEAQQKVAMAEAEAAALKAQKQEITPDLIKLREIEVQRMAIDKWDGHLPNVNGGAMPFLNLGAK